MSLAPLTSVSAGSVALALKLYEWAEAARFQPLSPGSHRFIEPWSFLIGLFTGIILYAAVEWALTIRWVLIRWTEARLESRLVSRPKELYKLL